MVEIFFPMNYPRQKSKKVHRAKFFFKLRMNQIFNNFHLIKQGSTAINF